MVGGDLLFKALVAFALAVAAAFGGDPAYAVTIEGSYKVVDVLTSPLINEAGLVGTATDFGALATEGYALLPSQYGGAGAAFGRTIAQQIANAGTRTATMDLAETIVAPVAEIGVEAAALCFANPPLCLASAVATSYLAPKFYEFLPVSPGVTPVWAKPTTAITRSCSTNVSLGQLDYLSCYNANLAYNATVTPNQAQGCGSGAGIQTVVSGSDSSGPIYTFYQLRNLYGQSTGAKIGNGCTFSGGWSGNSGTGVGAPRAATQDEMAIDIQSAPSTVTQSSTVGLANLASFLMSNGQPLPIDGTATSSLTPTTSTVSASSSVTNPDGTTTTTTDTYSANCTGGSIAATQCAFNTVTNVSNATTTTSSTTNNLPNTATQTSATGQAQEAKQCGDASGDACFVKPTDSFTAPTIGDAKTFQQSASDFYSAVSSAPLLAPLSGLSIGSAPCPVYTLTIPYLHNASYTIDAHCTILATAGPAISATMYVVWTLIAALILLSA